MWDNSKLHDRSTPERAIAWLVAVIGIVAGGWVVWRYMIKDESPEPARVPAMTSATPGSAARSALPGTPATQPTTQPGVVTYGPWSTPPESLSVQRAVEVFATNIAMQVVDAPGSTVINYRLHNPNPETDPDRVLLCTGASKAMAKPEIFAHLPGGQLMLWRILHCGVSSDFLPPIYNSMAKDQSPWANETLDFYQRWNASRGDARAAIEKQWVAALIPRGDEALGTQKAQAEENWTKLWSELSPEVKTTLMDLGRAAATQPATTSPSAAWPQLAWAPAGTVRVSYTLVIFADGLVAIANAPTTGGGTCSLFQPYGSRTDQGGQLQQAALMRSQADPAFAKKLDLTADQLKAMASMTPGYVVAPTKEEESRILDLSRQYGPGDAAARQALTSVLYKAVRDMAARLRPESAAFVQKQHDQLAAILTPAQMEKIADPQTFAQTFKP